MSATPSTAPLALPPEHLRSRVTGSADAAWFEQSGALSLADLGRALAAVGRSVEEFGDVLDWGCGCGRMLRHLTSLSPPMRLSGCDIDAEAIEWVRQTMPSVRALANDGLPPLPFEDASFDLIYNHSVLSHLDETYQDAWLAELSRIVRPGGLVTVSIHGPHAFEAWLSELPAGSPDRALHAGRMRRNGIVFRSQDVWSGGPFPDFYHTTYHAVGYVFERWTRRFDIRAYLPRGALGFQDVVVLQRPLSEAATRADRAPAASRAETLSEAWRLLRDALRLRR